MNTCLIITGGEYSPVPENLSYNYSIACDLGYEHAKTLGITPDLIIGDFDSLQEEQLLDVQIPVVRHPSKKDDSDTMLAIKYAIRQGYDHICMICALGGRWDHAFANVQSMTYAAKHGVTCEIIAKDDTLRTFFGGEIRLKRRERYAFSLFALTDTCEHICITGAKYPAEDITLTNDFPLGLSNAWEADEVKITMDKGIMLIVESYSG